MTLESLFTYRKYNIMPDFFHFPSTKCVFKNTHKKEVQPWEEGVVTGMLVSRVEEQP